MQTGEKNVLEYGRVVPSKLDDSLGRTRHRVAEAICVALHEFS
jgi:hypothetical protein